MKTTVSEEPRKSAILRPINVSEQLILDECTGMETLANASDVFKAGIDLNFGYWGTNRSGVATKEQPVTGYEVALSATYPQMFNSLTFNRNKLRLEQHQITNFCEKYPQHLSRKGATLFLFEVDCKFFVARVSVNSDGLLVLVHHFENDSVWYAKYCHRLVVPQLET